MDPDCGTLPAEGECRNPTGVDEIATRIESYEMAYRMQSSVPELTAVSDESESTYKLYGEEARLWESQDAAGFGRILGLGLQRRRQAVHRYQREPALRALRVLLGAEELAAERAG